MTIQKTTGIILSSRQLGEADIQCTVLTQEFGKRSFIFKGLQKSKKRNRAAAEAGAISNLVYYYHQEKPSHIVKEFSTHTYFPSIRDNLDKIYNLYFILEIIDKTSGFDDQTPILYQLLRKGIEALASTEHPVFFTSFFIIHLLKHHGILPAFKQCKKCGTSSLSGFYFDIADLHIVCNSCDMKKSIFSESTRDFLLTSLSAKFSSLDFSSYIKDEIMQLAYTLHLFIENYYHVKIKSGRFVYGK